MIYTIKKNHPEININLYHIHTHSTVSTYLLRNIIFYSYCIPGKIILI